MTDWTERSSNDETNLVKGEVLRKFVQRQFVRHHDDEVVCDWRVKSW